MSGIPAPEIFARAAPLIREAEGFSATPYRDAGGVATIGFGSTHYGNGRAVSLTDPPIDRGAAQALLENAMAAAWQGLARHLARAPTLNQAAALLSLAFNVGAGTVATSSLLAKFNAGDIVGAAQRFADFDKARIGSVLTPLPGLAARLCVEALDTRRSNRRRILRKRHRELSPRYTRYSERSSARQRHQECWSNNSDCSKLRSSTSLARAYFCRGLRGYAVQKRSIINKMTSLGTGRNVLYAHETGIELKRVGNNIRYSVCPRFERRCTMTQGPNS